MLTRLRVRGFKNLRDGDVKFAAFTCVAGPNGVGESNIPSGKSLSIRIHRWSVADSSSDRALVPIVESVFDAVWPRIPFVVKFAEALRSGPLDLRMRHALANFPCDVLLAHRDAESQSVEFRASEIVTALRAENISTATVQIIPVCMTESWLLVDETAIRNASGNPRGRNLLALPRGPKFEPGDTKQTLFKAIEAASELPPGRLHRLDLNRARQRVAELLDVALLMAVPSFRHFRPQFESLFAETT